MVSISLTLLVAMVLTIVAYNVEGNYLHLATKLQNYFVQIHASLIFILQESWLIQQHQKQLQDKDSKNFKAVLHK